VVNHQESITADFCNKICHKQTFSAALISALRPIATRWQKLG
jgi:hypothetical protein